MGCGYSDPGIKVDEEKELRSYLTPEDIRLVQESWDLAQADIDVIGLNIFKRLFEHNKHLKKLFHSKLAKDSCPAVGINWEQSEFDEGKMIMHGRIVMEALGAAVECLDDSEQLTILLIGIGERHVMYGVRPEMIPLLWPAIVSTLEDRLGSYFTAKVGLAWEHVFQYIGSKVVEGIARWRTEIKNMCYNEEPLNTE